MSVDPVNGLKVPKRLQIETVYGCNARCIMCALSKSSARKKGVMDEELFRSVVDSMSPYCSRVEKVDLFAMGEPLLDPGIFDRIRYVREKGFRNISISTNADLLDSAKQELLLETGIETVIFSIDGTEKQTHESIRPGVTFEQVVDNCRSFLKMRDAKNKDTRAVIRFIRQPNNKSQWPKFKSFWQQHISSARNDLLIAYDVNTMGGTVSSKGDIIGNRCNEEIERLPCHQVFDRLIILSDGSVPLCCEDAPNAEYLMGDAKTTDPIVIFNNEKFTRIREIHTNKKKTTLKICDACTLLYSEATTEVC